MLIWLVPSHLIGPALFGIAVLYGARPAQFVHALITTTFREVPWAHQVPFSQAQPGDLVEPESGHVVMHLAGGYNVQESTWGQVSHVKREYSSAFWTGWIDASKI